jgi:hypothetical protein
MANASREKIRESVLSYIKEIGGVINNDENDVHSPSSPPSPVFLISWICYMAFSF